MDDARGPANLVDRTLERVIMGLYAVSTVAILAIAVAMLVTMDGAPANLGIRLFVAIAAIMLLGAADSQLDRMLRRRDLFSVGDSSSFRRYRYLSLAFLILAGIGLCGLAWIPTRASSV